MINQTVTSSDTVERCNIAYSLLTPPECKRCYSVYWKISFATFHPILQQALL